MRSLHTTCTLLFSVLVLAAGGCEQELEFELSSASQPVLGGEEIDKGQFPTAVGVVVGQGGLCTGTLVAPDLVVTAAHCVSPSVLGLSSQSQLTQLTQVVFDATDVFGNGGRAVRAIETIPHPSFTRPGQPDIGLIRLYSDITDRTPTPINTDPLAAPIGVEVTMVGYGLNDLGQSGTGFFLKGQQSTECSTYGVSDDMFLCFNQQSGRGKCSGDSGGPSYATVDGVEVLVGVTSFGDQNCQYFGAEFRVDAARPFLEEHAPELFCIEDSVCDATCGAGGGAADPDCAPQCATDGDCDANSVCNVGEGVCEAAPFTPGGIGAECGEGLTECGSGLCAAGPEGSFCSQTCTTDAECPDSFECAPTSDGSGVCWFAGDSGGCSVGSDSGPLGTLLFALMTVVAVLRRRWV